MIVVNRFDVPSDPSFPAEIALALEVLSQRPGFVRGRVGRAVDDGTAWVLTTEWESVGMYRRALSAYEVKVQAWTLLGRARNEASAFEVLQAVEGGVAETRESDRS